MQKKHSYGQGKDSKSNTKTTSVEAQKEREQTEYHSSNTTERFWGMTRFEWIMSALTLLAAAIAFGTGVIIWKQVEGMRVDQRAWININFGNFSIVENEPLRVPMELVNAGKTPALHVFGHAVIEKVSRGSLPRFGGSPANPFDSGMIVPNEKLSTFGFQSLHFKDGTEEIELLKLSKDDISDIDLAKAYVAVHGTITYDDIFGRSHWLKFCSYNSPVLTEVQDISPPCVRYNSTGDN